MPRGPRGESVFRSRQPTRASTPLWHSESVQAGHPPTSSPPSPSLPTAVNRALCTSAVWSCPLQQPFTLRRGKPRLREAQQTAQGYTARKWQSWEVDPVFSSSKLWTLSGTQRRPWKWQRPGAINQPQPRPSASFPSMPLNLQVSPWAWSRLFHGCCPQALPWPWHVGMLSLLSPRCPDSPGSTCLLIYRPQQAKRSDASPLCPWGPGQGFKGGSKAMGRTKEGMSK